MCFLNDSKAIFSFPSRMNGGIGKQGITKKIDSLQLFPLMFSSISKLNLLELSSGEIFESNSIESFWNFIFIMVGVSSFRDAAVILKNEYATLFRSAMIFTAFLSENL